MVGSCGNCYRKAGGRERCRVFSCFFCLERLVGWVASGLEGFAWFFEGLEGLEGLEG
jgi:hypothetical protein